MRHDSKAKLLGISVAAAIAAGQGLRRIHQQDLQ